MQRYLKWEPYAVQISTSGDNTILAAPASGREYVVSFLQVQNDSAVDTTALVKFGTTTVLPIVMPAKGDGMIVPLGDDTVWRVGSGEALVVNLSGANAVWVTVRYYIDTALG